MSGPDLDAESLKRKTEAFLAEFFAKGEVLVRELIEENERLRATATGRLPEPGTVSPVVVRGLMNRLESLEKECSDIRRLAGSVQRESGGYRDRLDVLEHEHYHLASMYVAANQFYAALGLEEVVNTLTEVLLNFVGVGGFTVYAVDEPRNVLFPITREGDRGAVLDEIALDVGGELGTLLAMRRPWRVGDPTAAGPGVIMHLPLFSGSRLVGVVRLESFLPQKSALTEADFGLIELLSGRVGAGIESAWIRAHASEVPLQREKLEALVKA